MKRPASHVQEDKSEAIFREYMPDEWIIRRKTKDYGIDLEVELVQSEIVTGKVIWIQLKSRIGPIGETEKDIKLVCPLNFLRYVRGTEIPVILALIDVASSEGYWLNIRDYIRRELKSADSRWGQHTVNVRIPREQSLSIQKQKNHVDFIRIASSPMFARTIHEVYPNVLAMKQAWENVYVFLCEPDDEGFEAPDELEAALFNVKRHLEIVSKHEYLLERIVYDKDGIEISAIGELRSIRAAIDEFIGALGCGPGSHAPFATGMWLSSKIKRSMDYVLSAFEYLKLEHRTLDHMTG